MKNSTDLQRLSKGLGYVVQSSFFRTALIPILTVQLVLLCLYFFSNHYINEKNLGLLRSNALETIQEISRSEARYLNDQLKEISRNNRSLQAEHQALLQSGIARSERGAPTKSSVFVSSNTKLDPEVREKIIKSEKMDVRFAALVDNNPNLISSSFISWDNVVRTYPKVDNFYDKHPVDFDFTQQKNYRLATAMVNPKRTSVWTDTYLDPDGKGWMLSSLTPVYNNNFLEGVNVLPVTLSTFSDNILSKNLQWDSAGLVMDKHGNILTMSRVAELYLGLTDVGDYNSKDTIRDSQGTKPTSFNLLKQNTLAGMYFSEFFNGSDKFMEFTLYGEDYLVTKQIIPETGWQLFILTPLNVVYGPIIAERENIYRLGFMFLCGAALFYLLFFIYLNRTSKKLAKRITKPIAKVKNMIAAFEVDDETHKAPNPVYITELDELLSMNLKIQKAKLRYQKISKEMRIKNKQLKTLAITDQLTQIYNRLKLDEVLNYEVARAQRDNAPLTVAIIDIDKFKAVNDTFGHQIGDSVLIGVAQVMVRNIRSTDILGRWGGEEFMLILPNTSLENAYDHANKLRRLIENANFNPVKQVTISLGLATCVDVGCQKQLIENADNALYEAKNNGRNRVEMAPVAAV